ncbi:MAG: hypothetical protein OET44_06970 [Gammaproteobacteria bacterium]|nr:hypothetical protein [Gammaproteobacteria bacterium]
MFASQSTPIIATRNVRDYFQESVNNAISNQRISTTTHTADYVVDLLVSYTRSDRLFETTPDGKRLTPLAMLYFEALHADSHSARNRNLQRLGDVALFITGLFADSLHRKLVDVDYYIAMGGNAYAYLADNMRSSEAITREVFEELSEKFVKFVDVLMEVAEQARPACHSDVLKLYELWVKTGSQRAAGQLRNLGIVPVKPKVH